MIIIVTGAVGSGKTTFSKKLSRTLGFKYVGVNRIVKEKRLYDKYDKKFKSYIVDVRKLRIYFTNMIKDFKKKNDSGISKSEVKVIIDKLKDGKKVSSKKGKGLVIDSHLSHYIPSKYVDYCVVTKCDVKILNKRLKKRGYNVAKIKENLETEIFNICYEEALEKGYRPIVVVS